MADLGATHDTGGSIGGASSGPTSLAAGALKLPEVLMQAVTHIAPAIGVITSLAFITSVAGITSPIAFVIGGVICVGVAIGLTQLAKHIAGAGGYFLYVSRTVGPRAGFFTAWIYFLYDPLAYGMLLAWFGGILHDTLNAQYGWGPPWWLTFVVGLAILTGLIVRGVSLSSKVVVVLGLGEIVILVALAISGLVDPGKGGLNVSPFNPGNAPSANALYLGVIFTILSFSGFESVAPLAEETENPRRNLPRAIIFSILIMIAFYIFTSWGLLVGWGTNSLTSFTSSPDPIFQLGRNLWGGAWLLVLLALFNSTLANCIATGNASTRVFFAMGRTGVLPRWLSKTHPRFKTPVNAIALQTAIAIIVGVGLSLIIGAVNTFYFIGTTLTLGLIFVYSAGNLGVFLLYWRELRSNFNLLIHGLIPLATTLALIWVGWKSIEGLHILHPKGYLDWAPTVVGAWVVIGIVVVLVVSGSGNTGWLELAGRSVAENEVPLHDAGNPPPRS
jgi:amino acid transporter